MFGSDKIVAADAPNGSASADAPSTSPLTILAISCPSFY
jgi:hypothetical protein